MVDASTALEQHVDAIKAALNTDPTPKNRVDVRVGELGKYTWGSIRRVLFEATNGELSDPASTGLLEVETDKYGKPYRSIQLRVKAHIVAESHPILWVLWQNVVIASHDSLKSNSIERDFDLAPGDMGMAANLYDDAKYLIQEFDWVFHMFDRIVALPPLGEPLPSVTDLGDMYPLAQKTQVEDFLDPDEEDP